MNILNQANLIVNHRTEEKERRYGPFGECMERMKDIFNSMTGLECTTEQMYQAMIAMKLARQAYAHREDNLLDLVAYTGALNNYIINKEQNQLNLFQEPSCCKSSSCAK